MSVKKLKNELIKKRRFKKEFERYDVAEEIATSLVKARVKRGLTQEKLAKLVGTSQPNIARTESGDYLPSISFLLKVASVLDIRLRAPEFEFKQKGVSSQEDEKQTGFSSLGGDCISNIPNNNEKGYTRNVENSGEEIGDFASL